MRPNNLYQGNGPIKNYNKSTWDPWVNKLIWFLKGNHLCLRQFLHQYTTNHATTETTLLSNSNHILNLHTYHNIYHTLKIINTSPKCHTPCQLPYDLKSITMGKAIKYIWTRVVRMFRGSFRFFLQIIMFSIFRLMLSIFFFQRIKF